MTHPVDADSYSHWLAEANLSYAEVDAEARYVWVDVETTGLDPDVHVLLELAMLVTDKYGNPKGPPLAMYLDDTTVKRRDAVAIAGTNRIVNEMHTKSGLWHHIDPYELFHQQILSPPHAEIVVADWLSSFGDPKSLYMAGSTVGFDRFAFIQRYMPEVHEYCHHRSMDNSTIKILCEEHNPYLLRGLPTPKKLHRALPDIVDSIKEHQFYLDNFFFIPGDAFNDQD